RSLLSRPAPSLSPPLSLHDALPISVPDRPGPAAGDPERGQGRPGQGPGHLCQQPRRRRTRPAPAAQGLRLAGRPRQCRSRRAHGPRRRRAAKAQVQNATINLGYASVSSPIDGRAGKQQVTEGALVGQGSATLLTTVRQIDPLYMNFSLPIERLQQMRAAQAAGKAVLSEDDKAVVHITMPGGSEYAHTGTLDFAGVSVDPSTGAVSLRALIPNPEHTLLPGMYASMKVNMGTLNHASLIPQSAVLRDADSAYVLVVGKDNKVQRKDITTQGMRKGDWIVTGGIDTGDHIIVS